MAASKDRLVGFSLFELFPSNGHHEKEKWVWRPNTGKEDRAALLIYRQDCETVSIWLLTRGDEKEFECY